MTRYITDINTTTPDGASDLIADGDNEIRQLKADLKNSFPKIAGEVSASSTDLNKLVGFTGNVLSDAADTVTGTYVFTNVVNLNSDVSVSGGFKVVGTSQFQRDVTISGTLTCLTGAQFASMSVSETAVFLSAVRGSTPVAAEHLATKGYVDAAVVAGADPTTVDLKEFKNARLKLFYYGQL